MTAGWVSLILGIVGIFVPLLPTTPFVLLTAYCFSKSSPRLHRWLINQPHLGPMIQNWQEYGSISHSAKITSTVLIVGLFSCSLWLLNLAALIKAGVAVIGISVLYFIWTRPTGLSHFDQLLNRPTDARKNLMRLS